MSAPVGIVFNPISGAGRAAKQAQLIAERLAEEGIPSISKISQPAYERDELKSFLRGLRALLVVGGDGTLMPLLQALADSQVPVSMYPAGNESLFARCFQMKASFDELLQRLVGGKTEAHFFGLLDGKPFFSMVSVGLDADVVQRVSERRTGTLGTKGYIRPLLESLLTFRVPTLTVLEDEKRRVESQQGYLNIANCSEYARCLRLVPEASSGNGELCGRFYPHRSVLFYLRWLIPMLFRRPIRHAVSECLSAKKISIFSERNPTYVQADGEAAGVLPVCIEISAQTINVLVRTNV